MSYLIDINVVSELARPKPDAAVLDWFASTPDDAPFLNILTQGEIHKGIEKLASTEDTQRREKLRLWLEHDLRDWFGPRILPIGPAARASGPSCARHRQPAGRHGAAP